MDDNYSVISFTNANGYVILFEHLKKVYLKDKLDYSIQS